MRRRITERMLRRDRKRAMEGTVGEAEAVYFRMWDVVDFARDYFERVL
jgi:hypothetical protein